ncbi:MAG TPA: ABC transporter substrate-binding protein [Candidatus Acidoferrales bacterium]|nr:ABC transporter substrate-binding protein [Candidatus Acidoferrales bacterium]
MRRIRPWNWAMALAWIASLALLLSRSIAAGQTIDEVYKQALKEDGVLNCYCSIAQVNAQKIFPVFEKRFPGIRINHVDATADKLAVRAMTEARGGRVIADVIQVGLENIVPLYEQGLVLEKLPPEAAEYPANLKGPYWIANNITIFVGAWNTNLVKKAEEPKAFDDFADPRWNGRLIAEPRDAEILIGLMHKHKSLEKAIEILRKIALNKVEFHKGHSELAEFLVAGQGAACFTCYSHHYPPRIKQGAPVGYFLTEGIGTIIALSMVKGAPHPNTALLYTRWASSEEGAKVFAMGGRTPAHPKVEPTEPIRPKTLYAVGASDIKEFAKYQKIWKDIFKLR